MTSCLRLMLVGRNRLVRDCLVSLLGVVDRFRVVAQVADLGEAVLRLDVSPVDVVVLDHGPMRESAQDEIRCFRRSHGEPKILVVGVARNEDIVACIEAGASGYLAKEASILELTQAIDSVNKGQIHCSPGLTRSLFDRLAELAQDAESQTVSELFELTARELEVLDLLAKKLTNREIASCLSLSPYTVKNHVHNLLGKLDASDRVEAVRKAFRRGWLLERRGLPGDPWPAV